MGDVDEIFNSLQIVQGEDGMWQLTMVSEKGETWSSYTLPTLEAALDRASDIGLEWGWH